MADSRQQERAARNEALFRAANERLKEAAERVHDTPAQYTVMCECALPTCDEMLEIDAAAYQRVREHPRWFMVRPGHVVPEVERPVERHDSHWIVEKTGAAGDLSEALA